VYGAGVRATWLPDERFWYRVNTPSGMEVILVDPAKGARYSCKTAADKCAGSIDSSSATPAAAGRRGPRTPEVRSPDGKRAVFIRNYNLWVRDVATNQEKQITSDGVKSFGYATDNAGWTHSDRPVVSWSPDSKKIATFQQDERGVGTWTLVSTAAGHPTAQTWAYPLPGDSIITTIQRVVVDVDNAQVIRFQMPADQHRSTLCDDVSCDGGFTDVQWYPDASKIAFISSARDHKKATLRIADATTGAIRDVYTETVATQYESGQEVANWKILPATNEFLWFSERDDWGQLYLYDLTTGQLKNQVTTGAGNVISMDRLDEKTRTLWFRCVGKTPGMDPYFHQLCRVQLDGKKFAVLTSETGDHTIQWSPSQKYFVDTYSQFAVPPVTVLRNNEGKILATLEKADISRLIAKGWRAPMPITVKARDGKTDLFGVMQLPSNFDSTKKYPIINYIYPGPQAGSVGNRGFAPARGDNNALSELGFIVVSIDGMGTPYRSKSFHDAYYGRMGDNTLPDQVAGMKELAQRYKFIDIDKAGMWGHSGGGFATADAMFRYPDFFKVGISESGNHDNRVYEDDWGERYQGLLTRTGPNADSYMPEANQTLAKNLKGKLLLAHGTVDDNVPPQNTELVVDALIKANKDFDLLMLPNQPHGYGSMSSYMMRRRWDYFVKNLLGAEPPKEYEIKPPQPPRLVP
jgi:dipeptidyl aminopeptidase/acylaminoacyl peptidase